ncbi:MAG TPA: potassium-transporting ATPase subunit KdpC [Bryobacteraceae bacterium]|jgi:K+-transporting ATPase ATPase C chain
MWQQILPAFRAILLMTVLTGLIYPGVVTGLAQVLFHDQANGSLIEKDGHVAGSSLIGQNFSKPEYFHPRPSAAGSDGYDSTASSGSNLGPTNQKLIDRIKGDEDKFRKDNPDFTGPVPADLLTASASGLDPHISPASASAQVARVAKARGIDAGGLAKLVDSNIEGRTAGFIGEPRVNVLLLNLALDKQFPVSR